jgi:plastocyanin
MRGIGSSRLWRRDAAALMLGLVVGSGVAAASANPKTVFQRNKTFDPERIEVARGETINFTNDDPYIHHLYIEEPSFLFDSGDQQPGKVVSIRFDKAGTFVLRCAIHLKMELDIVVR